MGTGIVYPSGLKLSSPTVCSYIRVAQSLVFGVVIFFSRSLFVLFLLDIVLSVHLQFTASDNSNYSHTKKRENYQQTKTK
jgi:hypothetical protein